MTLYAIRTEDDLYVFFRRVLRAIRLEQPITFTYREQKKDPDNPKRRLNGECEITTRTIEPYDIAVSQKCDMFIRSLDRDTGDCRSWRFDRVLMYTPQRGIRAVTRP